MKLRISTLDYVMSHGKEPRGCEHWAFQIHDDSSCRIVRTVWCPGMKTLTAAKKWLAAWVKENMAAELATGYLSASVAP